MRGRTEETKKCSRCKYEYPAPLAEYFNKNRATPDGLCQECKSCHKTIKERYPPSLQSLDRKRKYAREYMRRKREEHPEEVKECKRLYYQRNKENILAKDAMYRASNLEKIRDRARRYHHANRERNSAVRKLRYDMNGAEQKREWRLRNAARAKASHTAWKRNNPEKMHIYDTRKRSKRNQAIGRFTVRDVGKQYRMQSGLCFWCHVELQANVFHVDHVVPISKGGTNWPDNIVIACPPCNNHKHNLMPDEWLRRLKKNKLES